MARSNREGSRGKPVTRRTLLSRRDGLTEAERAAGNVRITQRATELLDRIAPGGVVALYAGKGSEVETIGIDAAARQRGLRVVYPRVVPGERVLEFGESTPDGLVTAGFGLREPAEASPPVSVEDIDMFFVPGVAFDRQGGRIGWGHGHYDATLAGAKPGAIRVGLAFECQVTSALPREGHDVLMNVIVTETATHVV